jgi:hypothetical protein
MPVMDLETMIREKQDALRGRPLTRGEIAKDNFRRWVDRQCWECWCFALAALFYSIAEALKVAVLVRAALT